MGASGSANVLCAKSGKMFFFSVFFSDRRAESHNKININPVPKLLLILRDSGRELSVLGDLPGTRNSSLLPLLWRKGARSSLPGGRHLERGVASTRPDLAHPRPQPLARRLASIRRSNSL